MIGLNLALWLAGAVLLGLGAWRARAPFQRMAELDRLAENARRYESWRGGRRTAAAGDGITGADVMRQVVRRQAMLWAAVAILGVVLLAAGFAVR